MSNTVVITGANRGVGLALTRLYHDRGERVYAACRHASDELSQLGVNVIEGVDVGSDTGIERLVRELEGVSIDVLINNAGILRGQSLGSLDKAGMLEQYEINAVAPVLVTEALMNQLANGGKVALVTSRMGSIADNSSGGSYGYRMSKAALNAAGMSLSHDLKSRGVAVAILHPGYVATDMVGGHGDLSPEQAAEGLAKRIDELTLETSGGFWHSQGQQLPW